MASTAIRIGWVSVAFFITCVAASAMARYGEGNAQGPIPAVGGQNYTYLLNQLNGFAVGHRAKVESELAHCRACSLCG